jgi:hypothetical protein
MSARPEVSDPPSDGDVYSVAEFCDRHKISVSSFYKFRSEMPRGFNIGSRLLITKEEATEWRRQREAKAIAAIPY